MLKVDIDGNRIIGIEFSGSGWDLTTEICSMIHAIYKAMDQNSPLSAAAFRRQMQSIISDPAFWAMRAAKSEGICAVFPMDQHRK